MARQHLVILERFGRKQGGHATRKQLVDAGVPYSTLSGWVASGRLLLVGRQTFRLASAEATPHGRILAACLDEGGVASHWTAASLHGFAAPRGLIDVTVVKGSARRAGRRAEHPLRVHETTSLPMDDVVVLQGIRATSVARTLMGLAALVPEELSQRELFDLLSRAVHEDKATDGWLWWLLERRRCSGRNGVAAFEEALAERSRLGRTESWLERELLYVLDRFHLPRPNTQRVIKRRGRFVARVDFDYLPVPVVLEALGYRYHRTPEQLEDDTRRAAEMQAQGLEVYQFTSEQIVRRPAWVAGVVHEALARHGVLAA